MCLCELTALFCSLAVLLDPTVGHTVDVYFLRLSLSSVILIDSSTASPVYVLMLSIQAVRGLSRLRARGLCEPRFLFRVHWHLPRTLTLKMGR